MQVLDIETGIDFGANGNLKGFDPVGFSPSPEDISTWSEAPVAEVTFRLPPLRHDLRFTVEVFPYLGEGRIKQQSCWVFFNGLFVHFHPVRGATNLEFTVARDQLNPRANRLSFALPDATAPNSLGLGNDLRLLGLSFVRLAAANPADAPEPGGERQETPAGRVVRGSVAAGRGRAR